MATDLFSSIWDEFSDRSTPEERAKRPSFSTLFQNFELQTGLQKHLFNIYSTLALMLITATVGSIATFNSPPHPWLWTIIQIACVITFYFTNATTQFASINLRSILLYIISGTTGILLNPLLQAAIDHNPMVIPLALFSTTIVFGAFTFAAFKADRMTVLYYYSSIAMIFGMLSFYSLIIGLFGMNLLPTMIWTTIGLVFTLFAIVLDTQNIVYKYEQAVRQSGSDNINVDYKDDALMLFWNFMKLFVRLLHLIMKYTSKKNDNDNNNNRRRRD